MAFSEPQSLTIGGVATSFPRVDTGANRSVYLTADGNRKLTIASAYGPKRVRRTARLDLRKVAADVLFPAQNTPYTESFYFVCDSPLYGFTTTELKDEGAALMTWATASTNANLIKILGGEN